jgi:WD40 repeat protein
LSETDARGDVIEKICFSADGRTLVVGTGVDVWVFRVAAAAKLRNMKEFPRLGRLVALAEDGKTMITESASRAYMWNIKTGKNKAEWDCPKTQFRLPGGKLEHYQSLVVSPNGKLLASRMQMVKPIGKNVISSRGEERVRVFDSSTGRSLFASKFFPSAVEIAFSPDSRCVAVAGNEVLVLHAKTGKTLHRLPSKDASIIFSPNGKWCVAISASQGYLDCWDLASGRKVRTVSFAVVEQPAFVQGFPAALARDGRRAWVGHGYVARSWDLDTGEEIPKVRGHRRPVSYLYFTNDGQRLLSGCDESVCEWDQARGRRLRQDRFRFGAWKGELMALSIPLGRAVWRTGSGAYELRSTRTGRLVREIREKSRQLLLGNPFAFAGKWLLNFSQQRANGARFWRYHGSTGEDLTTVTLESVLWRFGTKFLCSPDGKVIAARADTGEVIMVSLETGRALRRIPLSFVPAKEDFYFKNYRFAFSADGSLLAFALRDLSSANLEENAIHVIDLAKGREVARVAAPVREGLRFAAAALALSPDNRFVAFSMHGDDSVRVWEIASESERARLVGHRAVVTSLAFSPDGKQLASGSEDTTVLIWDMDARPSKGPQTLELTPKELATHWKALANRHARPAKAGIQALVRRARSSVPYIRSRLQPVRPVSESGLGKLIRSLESDQFRTRQSAMRELRLLGELAGPALENAARGKLSAQARRSVQQLLKDAYRLVAHPEMLRDFRAVEALEQIGSAPAQGVLRSLAQGAPAAWLTRQARASLQRLQKRGGNTARR